MVINHLLTGGATWIPKDAPRTVESEICWNWIASIVKYHPQENGKSTMNEDVFPIENGGFSNAMLVFRGVNGMEIFDVYSETHWIRWIWGVKKRQRSPPQPRLRQHTRQRLSVQPQSQPRIAMRSQRRGCTTDHWLAWDDLIVGWDQAMCCAMTPKRTMMKLPGNKCGLPIKESSCPCVYQRWEEFEISFASEMLGIFDTFQAFFVGFCFFWYFW